MSLLLTSQLEFIVRSEDVSPQVQDLQYTKRGIRGDKSCWTGERKILQLGRILKASGAAVSDDGGNCCRMDKQQPRNRVYRAEPDCKLSIMLKWLLINLDLDHVNELLYYWLSQHTSETDLKWLENKQTQIANGVSERVFFTAFSAVPRYIGKQDLQLTPEDLETAKTLFCDWVPSHWSIDQVGRTLLLLALPNDDVEKYLRSLDQIFSTSDMGELVVLYQSLPLLPYPERHRQRAAEGIRSNMLTVFQAVALQNPYPANYLDDIAWNQMVLKTIFVDSPLHLIWGLDRRANQELAAMLINYAHERWAAKRSVTPQLWRLVEPFINNSTIVDLEKVLGEGDLIQQKAAALACSRSPFPPAQALLSKYPNLLSSIQQDGLTWDSLSSDRL